MQKEVEEKLQDLKKIKIKSPRILENLTPYGIFSHNYQGLVPSNVTKPSVT